jgi:hypothetical protein
VTLESHSSCCSSRSNDCCSQRSVAVAHQNCCASVYLEVHSKNGKKNTKNYLKMEIEDKNEE